MSREKQTTTMADVFLGLSGWSYTEWPEKCIDCCLVLPRHLFGRDFLKRVYKVMAASFCEAVF